MKKYFVAISCLLLGCSSTQIISPVVSYERNEIKYSETKTLDIKLKKLSIFHFYEIKKIDGTIERITSVSYIEPIQLLHRYYTGNDLIVNPVVEINERTTIPGFLSDYEIKITSKMAQYIGK